MVIRITIISHDVQIHRKLDCLTAFFFQANDNENKNALHHWTIARKTSKRASDVDTVFMSCPHHVVQWPTSAHIGRGQFQFQIHVCYKSWKTGVPPVYCKLFNTKCHACKCLTPCGTRPSASAELILTTTRLLESIVVWMFVVESVKQGDGLNVVEHRGILMVVCVCWIEHRYIICNIKRTELNCRCWPYHYDQRLLTQLIRLNSFLPKLVDIVQN